MKIIIRGILTLMLSSIYLYAGSTLPDFELKNLSNKRMHYENVKGEKLTVIDFWATWCKPCIRALPKLNEIYIKYESDGVQFVGINVDSPRNDAKIRPFVNTYKLNYTILRDPNSAYSSEANVRYFPTMMVVDSERNILYIHQGFHPGDEKVIEKEIRKHLNSNEK